MDASHLLFPTNPHDEVDALFLDDFSNPQPSDLIGSKSTVDAEQNQQPFQGRAVLKQRAELSHGVGWHFFGFRLKIALQFKRRAADFGKLRWFPPIPLRGLVEPVKEPAKFADQIACRLLRHRLLVAERNGSSSDHGEELIHRGEVGQ